MQDWAPVNGLRLEPGEAEPKKIRQICLRIGGRIHFRLVNLSFTSKSKKGFDVIRWNPFFIGFNFLLYNRSPLDFLGFGEYTGSTVKSKLHI